MSRYNDAADYHRWAREVRGAFALSRPEAHSVVRGIARDIGRARARSMNERIFRRLGGTTTLGWHEAQRDRRRHGRLRSSE